MTGDFPKTLSIALSDYSMTGDLPGTLSKTVSLTLAVLLIMLRQWKYARISFPSSNQAALDLSHQAKRYIMKRKGIHLSGDFIGVLDGQIVCRE